MNVRKVLKELDGDWNHSVFDSGLPDSYNRRFDSKRDAYMEGKRVMFLKFKALLLGKSFVESNFFGECFVQNPGLNSFTSRNRMNEYKQKTKDRYLDDDFSKCPKCKTQNLIEFCVPEENRFFDFCLECGYKKFKEVKE